VLGLVILGHEQRETLQRRTHDQIQNGSFIGLVTNALVTWLGL
jgi:hypothetical protein